VGTARSTNSSATDGHAKSEPAVSTALGGEPIHPLAEWDLDHAAIPGAHEHGWYVGPIHRRCNRSHGAPPPRLSPPAPALAFFNPNAPAPPDAD